MVMRRPRHEPTNPQREYPPHTPQHSVTSKNDHSFPGEKRLFLRADGVWAEVPVLSSIGNPGSVTSVEEEILPFLFGSGINADHRHRPIESKGFMLENPVATDDMAVWRTDVAITLLEVHYLCVGGTNWVGQLQECDANGLNGADVQTTDTTASAGTDAEVTSFSNASIDAGDWVGIKTTSISGIPTRIHVTFYYRENP